MMTIILNMDDEGCAEKCVSPLDRAQNLSEESDQLLNSDSSYLSSPSSSFSQPCSHAASIVTMKPSKLCQVGGA